MIAELDACDWQYKGYTAKVEFVEEENLFRGEVVGLRDFIIFDGRSTSEARRSFHAAVDDYLEYCKSRGEKPDRPFRDGREGS